jgi:hypothetical protein
VQEAADGEHIKGICASVKKRNQRGIRPARRGLEQRHLCQRAQPGVFGFVSGVVMEQLAHGAIQSGRVVIQPPDEVIINAPPSTSGCQAQRLLMGETALWR